jgi:NADH-quinone oxidoreductase subunit N
MLFFTIDFVALAPEIFLSFFIHCILLFGVICTSSSHLNYPIILTNITWLSLQTLGFVFLLIVLNPLSHTFCFNKMLLVDKLSLFIKSIIVLTFIITLLISLKYNYIEKINVFELIILFLLAVLGLLLLVSAYNFISLYLALELQSFCLYILAAINRNSEFSTEAGLKYFVLGAFFSGLLLFGLSLIYGFSGVNDYGSLQQFLLIVTSNSYTITSITIASIFVLSAFFFKLSAAPFHVLTPDVYEGSATSISAFFAIVPKISILVVLTRFAFISFYNDLFFFCQGLFILTSLLSIVIGTFSALTQYKIKRLFAYSTISHVGFVLMGLCCGSEEGLIASYFYILIYIITTIICFTLLLSVYTKKNLLRLYYIKDLISLTRSNPGAALITAITFFSIAGVPPLAGFFSKMLIFMMAFFSNIYLLAVLGILASVVSCFYYIRIIRSVYFDGSYTWLNLCRFERENSLILVLFSITLVFTGIYPAPVFYIVTNSILF